MSLEVVAAIIFFEKKILVTQRKFHKNTAFSYKYEFPGGKVEKNEDKITALKREREEEKNLSSTFHCYLCTRNFASSSTVNFCCKPTLLEKTSWPR